MNKIGAKNWGGESADNIREIAARLAASISARDIFATWNADLRGWRLSPAIGFIL